MPVWGFLAFSHFCKYMVSKEKELNKDSTFYNKIENNPDICSNCYRRLKYRYESRKDIMSDELEYESHVGFGFVDDKRNTGRPSIKRSYCSCGVIDQGVKFRPFDRQEMMEVAHRIEKHLDEQEVDFHTDVFYSNVRQGRSEPQWQFNEEVLFQEAIESAKPDADDGITKGVK